MGKFYKSLLLLLISITFNVNAQLNMHAYEFINEEDKLVYSTLAMNNTALISEQIESLGLEIIHKNSKYLYVRSTIKQLAEYVETGRLHSFIVDYHKPVDLADSVRAYHNVNQVHNGIDLQNSYKGDGVVIGFVDTGIEIDHPDFKFADGRSRIYRIWDQTASSQIPVPLYYYGQVWTNVQINQDQCPHQDPQAHGTTVAGIAVGNGLAAGENKGIAPEADIIMVKYNGAGGAWSNRVTDGIDYIYRVADSLGKRAVVNVSLGSYWGSHDGNDPATLRAVDLINAQPGRILVTAAGNSGNFGKFHAGASLQEEEKFSLLRVETNTNYGANRIWFDGYSSLDSIDFDFSFVAMDPNSNFDLRGQTQYRPMSFLANEDPNVMFRDTIRNAQGHRLATVEVGGVVEGPNLHYSVLLRFIDSTQYHYGFMTNGTGRWDMWSGNAQGYNRFIEAIPSVEVFPQGESYVHPDLSQSIVSGWTCHPEIISVGNIRNRLSFMSQAGILYTTNPATTPGDISINSSKGPNRNNVIKPDIMARGDVTLTVGPFSFLTVNLDKTTPSGFHMGNGGTSMASPVIAAIGALYLERCPAGTQGAFMQLLKETSRQNQFMNDLPNNSFGHGYADAWGVLKKAEENVSVTEIDVLCDSLNLAVSDPQNMTLITWEDNSEMSERQIFDTGSYYYSAKNKYSCVVKSDTLVVASLGEGPELAPIQFNQAEEFLYTSGGDVYTWTINGVEVPNVSGAQLSIYQNDQLILGTVNVSSFSAVNCIGYAGDFVMDLSIEKLTKDYTVFPNPTSGFLYLKTDMQVESIVLLDATGRIVLTEGAQKFIDVRHLNRGLYVLNMQIEGQLVQTKVIIE